MLIALQVHAAMERRTQKRVSVTTASELLQVLWPDFVEVNGCIFVAFQWTGGYSGMGDPKTETESFINHTHIFDEFLNKATLEYREPVSDELDLTEEIYDESHPDFLAACEVGRTIARLWAMKLKADFPTEQFRVYYTQYDNPIVRFHKVRPDEPVWLDDEDLLAATDQSFRDAIIYDTDHLATPIVKKGF
jgi:hypothetical protein